MATHANVGTVVGQWHARTVDLSAYAGKTINQFLVGNSSAARNLPLGGLIVLPIELFQAGYNKEQELEADRDGTQLAVLAGYSPQGAIRMFQAFEKLEHQYVTKDETPDQEIPRVAIESITGYFRSHPLSAERERQIKVLIVSQRWPEPKEKPMKIALSSQRSALSP